MGIFQQFPYTNFHEMNLDQLIKIMREMQDEWAETKQQWSDVQAFIENYFENLDVSQEISDKLDQMAADGTLALILDSDVVNAVNLWLAAHITQPTTPAVDDTLQISGAAADSAAAGRYVMSAFTVGALDHDYTLTNTDFVSNEIWDSVTGAHTYSVNDRWVATPKMLYFPVFANAPFKIALTAGFTVSVNFYDINGDFVGHSEGTHVGWVNADASYIAMNVRKTDNSSISGAVFTVEVEYLYTEDVIKENTVNILDDIDVGFYYDTTTGHGASAGSLARTPIYKCSDVGMFFTNVTSRITAVFWDRDHNFLGYNSVENKTTPYYVKLRVIPEDACYVGFTVHDITVTEFHIRQINSAGLTVGDMSDSMQYAVINNAYYYNDSLSSIATYDACVLVNCDFDTIYNLADSSGGVTFIDRNSNVIDYHPAYVSDMHYGRRYDRPADAYITVVLLKHSQFTPVTGAYFSLSYDDPERVTMKGSKTFCLGDSIVWLDSTNGVDPTSNLLAGFQKQIRASGSIVDSLGVSGGTLVNDPNEPSIIRAMVNTPPAYADYDNFVIMGGLNDIRIGEPIGTVGTYASPNITQTEVIGAIGWIVSTIRAANPTASIFICTPLPTSNANRPYNKMMQYRDAIIAAATFWGIQVIDLTTESQRDIATTPTALSYDGTHPNNAGMEIIGKLITGTIIRTKYLV